MDENNLKDILGKLKELRSALEAPEPADQAKLLARTAELLLLARDLQAEAQDVQTQKEDTATAQKNLKDDVQRLSSKKVAAANARAKGAEDALAAKDDVIGEYQTQMQKRDGELKQYLSLRAMIGENIMTDPDAISQYIRTKEEAIRDLRTTIQDQDGQIQHAHKAKAALQEELDRYEEVYLEKKQLKEKNAGLQIEVQNLQARLNTYENPEGNKLTRQARKEQLEALCDVDPCDRDSLIKKVRDAEGPAETSDEAAWVKGICGKIEEEQYKFPKRVVQAFHTMLKCAEMSPLSVLAGISGTGKSLLPMLYARHAGIHFLNVPVQPNWDSQESMLGYYNSIENCFEAEPILPLLLLSQQGEKEEKEGKEGKDGYRDHMFMILLDEMNLAHVELYFAQFLSKLEERRVAGGVSLDIKIGPDVRPYPLSLGKNVLWVGTMNQDETTKSLSDKVLDRSNILYFPRPKELAERKFGAHSQKSPAAAKWLSLSRSWQEWCQPAEIDDALKVRGYKKLIEGMNKFLAPVNRALGHRVWQSIDLYLRLHPNVREAAAAAQKDETKIAESLDKAFVDQLVLKVMPKLRGIDNGSKDGKDCLNNIHTLIKDFKLTEQLKDAFLDDFGKAREAGYNQFQWCSSECMQDID